MRASHGELPNESVLASVELFNFRNLLWIFISFSITFGGDTLSSVWFVEDCLRRYCVQKVLFTEMLMPEKTFCILCLKAEKKQWAKLIVCSYIQYVILETSVESHECLRSPLCDRKTLSHEYSLAQVCKMHVAVSSTMCTLGPVDF